MAKKRISGFIVEIGGDTSKLGEALEKVDNKSKNLQKELRGVNSLLKLDPTNVELLKQKEELLTQSISETEKKIDILNQTMKKIDSGEVEVSEEQFRDLKREIEATKIKLNSYKGDLDGLKKSTSDFADETDEAKKATSEFASETKKADLSDFKKEIDDVKTSASNLKDEIKNTASEVAVSAAAIGTAAIGAVTTANEETKAMNSLQAQTGLTTQELEKYGGVIKSIYQNNFGESQEDIANTIAKIKQLTGETDPSKIQAMAENLYTMQDTFENFDIDETLRGVNGLMTNVNLTAEEAFDFLVTGTQRGLNYSGELADNIAEYSSLWGQAGFSSKEMFSILENGTKSGAYNLDKVNDFVKEFTISLSDGRIEENISSFSDGTGELFNAWKNGEATASEVFYSVIEDLKNTKTEQEALTTASNVWSSLGEDNALAVITSLGNVNTSYDNVKGKMNEIKEIKYDDVTTDFETLGRTIETDVIAPLGKKLYPTAEKICDFLSDHTDDIIPTLKTILGITGSIWAGQKAQSFANSIKGLVTTYKTLKTATEAAKISQQTLNTAQSANVIGAIVTAVGFLITAFTTLSDKIEEYNELKWSSSEAGKFAAEIDEIKGRLEETTSEITKNLENTLSELDSIYTDNALIDDYQKKLEELLSKAELSPEEQSQLETIVSYFEDNVTGFDEVWKKYVKVSEDGKIELNGDLSEIQTEISNTIDDYQRLTNLTAINELSTTNSKNKITANQELSKVEAEINAKTQEVNESYSEFLGLLYSSRGKESAEETLKRLKNNNNEVVTNEAWGEAYNTYLSNSKKLEELKNTHNESVAEMNKLIMTGDDLSDVIKVLNGDYSDAAAVMMAYNAGMINLSDVQESEWESLTKLQKAAEDTGKNTVIGIVEGTNKYKGALAENSNGLASTVLSEYDSVMEIHSPSRAMHRRGVWTVQGLIEGMFSKNTDVERAGEVSAIKAKKGGQKVSLFSLGNNLVSGFVNGILTGNAFKSIGEAAQTVAKNAYTTIKDWLGIKSPSRKAAQLGDFFSQGFSKGITINKGKVQQASEELARAAYETLKNNDVDFNLDVLNPKSSQAYEIALKYSNSQSQAETDRLRAIEAKLDKVCETIEKTSGRAIYLNPDTLVGSTTNKYDNSMADYSIKKNRGW